MNKSQPNLAALTRITSYPALLSREQAKIYHPKKSSLIEKYVEQQPKKLIPLIDGHKSMHNLIGIKDNDFSNQSYLSPPVSAKQTKAGLKSIFGQPNSRADPLLIPNLSNESMKSKTFIGTEYYKGEGTFSQAMSKNDPFNSPREGSASPGWNTSINQNENLGQQAMNNLTLAKQSLDSIGVKLERNFEKLKEGVGQKLSLLEDEVKLSGKNEFEFKKSGQIVESLIELVSDATRNELKLAQSGAQQIESTSLISIQKRKLDQQNSLLVYANKEVKKLTETKEKLEQELVKKDREITHLEKCTQNDKKRIQSLEKKLELLLDTGFLNYASQKQVSADASGNLSSPIGSAHNGSTTDSQHSKLRVILSELVRENEILRKKVSNLTSELSKSKESENSLSQTLSQYQSKIDSMKKKISEKDLEEIQKEEKALQKMQLQDSDFKANSNSFLKRMIIPKDADFRLNSIKFEFSQILMDIIEHGSNKFAVHFSRNKSVEKRIKMMSLLAGQFISYREFSNRFMDAIRILHSLFLIDDLPEIQLQIAKQFPFLLKSQVCRLWIKNSATGLLSTMSKDNKRIVCLPGKGVFSDIILMKLAVNFKNQIQNRYLFVELTDAEDNATTQLTLLNSLNPVKSSSNANSDQQIPRAFNTSTSMCLPIIDNEEVIGILEVSESCLSDGFGQEEEVFSVICVNYISLILNNLKIQRHTKIQSKYSNILNNCFSKCIAASSLLNLEKTIKQQLKEYFGINNAKVYFYKNHQNKHILSPSQNLQTSSKQDIPFFIYSLVDNASYSYKKGVVSESISNMKQILSQQISNEPSYDPFIDIKTLLPTLTLPLLISSDDGLNSLPVGVMQVPLKRRAQIQKSQDDLLLGATPLLGIDNNLESVLSCYANLIASAVHFRYIFEDAKLQK